MVISWRLIVYGNNRKKKKKEKRDQMAVLSFLHAVIGMALHAKFIHIQSKLRRTPRFCTSSRLTIWECEFLPGECGGGVHIRTTPCPSRTDTPPLVLPLKAPRSGKRTQENLATIPTVISITLSAPAKWYSQIIHGVYSNLLGVQLGYSMHWTNE